MSEDKDMSSKFYTNLNTTNTKSVETNNNSMQQQHAGLHSKVNSKKYAKKDDPKEKEEQKKNSPYELLQNISPLRNDNDGTAKLLQRNENSKTKEEEGQKEDTDSSQYKSLERNNKEVRKSETKEGTKKDKKEKQNESKSPYELLANVMAPNNENEVMTLSQIKRTRDYGEMGNSGFGMRESLIGFKEGVPGVYSGFKLRNTLKKRQSAPAFPVSTNDLPERPPRNMRPKSSSQLARIYDLAGDDLEIGEDILESEPEKPKISEKLNDQRVILEFGEDDATRVETGVRYYDPGTDSPTRPFSTVMLPMSLADDMSDSGESWGSDFDTTSEILDNENEIYQVLGQPRDSKVGTTDSDYEDIDKIIEQSERKKPPLPPRQSRIFETLVESDLDKDTYIPVQMEDEQQPVLLPPLPVNAEEFEIKRYQIIKCVIENEKIYMKSLERLIKEYEEPLLHRNLISQDRVKVIFKHVHEILQCHQLFNMGLSDRANEWETKDVLGDIIYAAFSKSTVLKAYSSFVSNFSNAMDSIKETCKLVPTFLKFLKNRLYRNNTKQSLYDLMRQPLERVPQLVILIQALLKVTPFDHADRSPLQMALTHLECLSETLNEKRKDSMCKHKVRQIDGHCTGLEKSLASRKRYYVRHDDMLLCLVEDGKIVKTKLRRIFILNDLLICASILNKQKQLKMMTTKKYKVKWCIPVVDVDVIDIGSGISIDVADKTTTIKYSHFSSPRPGRNSSQLLEDLQHDIAIIGEIAGKVAQLRKSYRFMEAQKVNDWYKDVKNLLDRETELANMHWIELSIPVQGSKNDRMRCLFNVHSPNKKMEWTAELENVKLRLADCNNPGWYLQEENVYVGETAVLRRTLPLMSHTLPLFLIEAKFSVQCVLEVVDVSRPSVLWIFSGNEHIGLITLMEMKMDAQPHVIESFVASQARICCAELVKECHVQEKDKGQNQSVWIGTMAGSLLLFDPEAKEKKVFASALLKDSIVTLKYSHGKVFAGLANGTLACFRRKVDASWDLLNPTVVCLGVQSVCNVTEANNRLWCACGSTIFILDPVTLGIENKIQTGKVNVKHLVAYGIGMWVSSWKSAKLQLYHAETLKLLQTITTTKPVSRMKNDIDGRIQNVNIDKIYITSLLAKEGLLWIGLNHGLILTYPLPRLGGIPTVSGQACVSFHAHLGPVKHLLSFKERKSMQLTNKNENCDVKSLLETPMMMNDTVSELDVSIDLSVTPEPSPSKMEPMYFLVEPDQDKQNKNYVIVPENNGLDADDEEETGELHDQVCVANLENCEEKIVTEYSVSRKNTSPTSDLIMKNKDLINEDTAQDDISLKVAEEKPTAESTSDTSVLKEGELDQSMENFSRFTEQLLQASTPDKPDLPKFLPDTFDESETAVINKPVDIDTVAPGKATDELRSDNTSGKPEIASAKPVLESKTCGETVDENAPESKGVEPQELDRVKNDESAANACVTSKDNEKESGKNVTSDAENFNVSENEISKKTELELSLQVDKSVELSETFKSKSDSGYELPISSNNAVVSDSYAKVDKSPDDSLKEFPIVTPAINNFNDEYRVLPLPHRPDSAFGVYPTKTPPGKLVDKSIYTPLFNDNLSTSLTSTVGMKAYEREVSLNASDSMVRATDESYYASLVAVSKREEESRRTQLLAPSYVVSVGVGHADLRKKSKNSTGFEFIRSFSNSTPEHLLLIWKLC